MRRIEFKAQQVMRSYYRYLGRESPEVEAEDLLENIRAQGGVWVSPNASSCARRVISDSVFDVDDLAENHLRIRLRIEPLQERDSPELGVVLGITHPRRREILVCERALSYEPLYRTTVMHEVAHIVLHGPSSTQRAAYAPFAHQRPPREQEADRFMASALLPTSVLFLAIAWVANSRQIRLNDIFLCANIPWGRHLWRSKILRPLIDLLCVSRHFICVAMSRLNVFTEDTVAFHRTYALPNKWLRDEPIIL